MPQEKLPMTRTLANPSPTQGPTPDPDLLDAARSGNAWAVAVLFRRHQPRALALAGRYATYDYAAEDLAADAMLGMLQALRQGHGPRTSVPAYLAVSVRNLAASAARRRAHAAHPRPTPIESIHRLPVSPNGPDQPESALLDAELREQVASALDKLHPSSRLILHLLHVDLLTVQECARRLGITPEAVRSMSYRARRSLRRQYQATWPEARSTG
jgi:RNA polymerase sigma factor (sigma-70 family)